MGESLAAKSSTSRAEEQVGQKRASPAIECIDPYLANHFSGRMLPASKEFGYKPEEHFRMW